MASHTRPGHEQRAHRGGQRDLEQALAEVRGCGDSHQAFLRDLAAARNEVMNLDRRDPA